MNYNNYITLSLNTHLFFDRIMKEHAFFLDISLSDKYNDLKKILKQFQDAFDKILIKAINLSKNNYTKNYLNMDSIITNNTLKIEELTNKLLGTNINTNITLEEEHMMTSNFEVNNQIVNDINNLNQETLPVIGNFINLKNDILNKVLTCKIYTNNYPLLIKHLIEEAKIYYDILFRINQRQFEINSYNSQLFWNNIMKEHAEFIRGLLDPSEKQLILTADKFAEEYQIINRMKNSNLANLTSASLKETTNFKDFKTKCEEAILNCRVKSIIVPLLSDHILREANYYLNLLNNIAPMKL